MQVVDIFLHASLQSHVSSSPKRMTFSWIILKKMVNLLNRSGKCTKFNLPDDSVYSRFWHNPTISRYCPIIPLVLVNGSEGIGTGWSTFVPNYNPRDIVSNIHRLLDGEPVEPMDPWYKRFQVSLSGWFLHSACFFKVGGNQHVSGLFFVCEIF